MLRGMDTAEFTCQTLPSVRPQLRIAVVTETYPPEVNGVAMTLGRLVDGLQVRNHQVQLIRPRQHADDQPHPTASFSEHLQRGIALPRYEGLKVGLPAKAALTRLWTKHRPDVVQIATEGPLGWSALAAANTLRLPVASDFHTNFHNYSSHYGFGLLRRAIVAYLRKFHNKAAVTLVPTESMRRELLGDGPERAIWQSRRPDAMFCGTQVCEALATHYASGDVFLFPSIIETWGNVTVEAMAAGLAVVAYDCAAAEEVIRHGENGLKVAPEDEAAFIAEAASLAPAAALQRRLGSAAAARAAQLSWDAIIDGYERVLLRLARPPLAAETQLDGAAAASAG